MKIIYKTLVFVLILAAGVYVLFAYFVVDSSNKSYLKDGLGRRLYYGYPSIWWIACDTIGAAILANVIWFFIKKGKR